MYVEINNSFWCFQTQAEKQFIFSSNESYKLVVLKTPTVLQQRLVTNLKNVTLIKYGRVTNAYIQWSNVKCRKINKQTMHELMVSQNEKKWYIDNVHRTKHETGISWKIQDIPIKYLTGSPFQESNTRPIFCDLFHLRISIYSQVMFS